MKAFLLLTLLIVPILAIELTFELPDNTNQCFYEDLKASEDSVIEFQVVTGGQYDIDMVLEDPNGNVLHKKIRAQHDSHQFKTLVAGTYKVCFSNEFSTVSHKIVYMDWQVGSEVIGGKRPDSPVNSLENSGLTIKHRLNLVEEYQTDNRIAEAKGRKRAEDLNERVLYWSMGQTSVIIISSIVQVILLKSFFSNKPIRN